MNKKLSSKIVNKTVISLLSSKNNTRLFFTSVADEVFPNGSRTGHGESLHAVRFLTIVYVIVISIG